MFCLYNRKIKQLTKHDASIAKNSNDTIFIEKT